MLPSHLDLPANEGIVNRSVCQCFFAALPLTVPILEEMELSIDLNYRDGSIVEIGKIVLSCSEKLHELSLTSPSCELLLDFFHPFRAENFDSHAPTPLAWPKLTSFKIGPVYIGFDRDNPIELTNQLILVVGRAVRHMPLIQSLALETGYRLGTFSWNINALCLTLKVSRDHAFYSSRADLFISHKWLDPEGNVAEAAVSEEAKEVWRESLLKGANAVLEVHAGSENRMNQNWDT